MCGCMCLLVECAFLSLRLCVCVGVSQRGQHYYFFVCLFIVLDTICAEGVENLSVGLSRIYFKPFYVVPGRFCFI